MFATRYSDFSRHFDRSIHQSIATGCLWTGAVLLAAEPARWLVGTWYLAGYDGIGWLAFVLVLGLAGLSLRTEVVGERSVARGTYGLLVTTAVIRLVAQILDVNVVGALLLAVDVYALAQLASLGQRRFSVSPLWLAVMFCFSLPIEPMVQRVLGYDLQHISAFLACGLLQPFFAELACEGVRLKVEGVDVLVDLPCSGAELLSIAAMLLTLINSVRTPDLRWGIASCVACLVVALLGNGMRIALLAAGIAHSDALTFSVMEPLPHTVIGLMVVGLGSLAVLAMSTFYPAPKRDAREASARAVRRMQRSPPRRVAFAFGFVVFAFIADTIQPKPVDASPAISPPDMPWVAAGLTRQSASLSPQEASYFTRYGGGAARASFGPYGLLLVSTASPLRHLHDPTICLSGMGYTVRLLGTDHAASSAVYLATRTTAEGNPERYQVRVSYRSSGGEVASSVSEVVRRWLREPTTTWTMVQRIVPDHPAINTDRAIRWELAIRRAFDLT